MHNYMYYKCLQSIFLSTTICVTLIVPSNNSTNITTTTRFYSNTFWLHQKFEISRRRSSLFVLGVRSSPSVLLGSAASHGAIPPSLLSIATTPQLSWCPWFWSCSWTFSSGVGEKAKSRILWTVSMCCCG